jgi:hypothetical protein
MKRFSSWISINAAAALIRDFRSRALVHADVTTTSMASSMVATTNASVAASTAEEAIVLSTATISTASLIVATTTSSVAALTASMSGWMPSWPVRKLGAACRS